MVAKKTADVNNVIENIKKHRIIIFPAGALAAFAFFPNPLFCFYSCMGKEWTEKNRICFYTRRPPRYHCEPNGSLSKTIMSAPTIAVLGGQGYIGSALAAYLFNRGMSVCSIDSQPARIPGLGDSVCRGFQDLTAEELGQYDAIVLLAGSSSVAACDESPAYAFDQNVSHFVHLVHKLGGQKLIFASSVSVYVDTAGHQAEESDVLPAPVSFYDCHKQLIERYAALSYRNSYALRFGTLSGPSPNMRNELLVNSLVRSAMWQGNVRVANGPKHRALLGINDLCRAIERILTQTIPTGCYNLASVNVRIGDVAEFVARRFQVPCNEVEHDTKYDVQVNTRMFREASDMTFHDTLPSLVEELHAHYAALRQTAPAES